MTTGEWMRRFVPETEAELATRDAALRASQEASKLSGERRQANLVTLSQVRTQIAAAIRHTHATLSATGTPGLAQVGISSPRSLRRLRGWVVSDRGRGAWSDVLLANGDMACIHRGSYAGSPGDGKAHRYSPEEFAEAKTQTSFLTNSTDPEDRSLVHVDQLKRLDPDAFNEWATEIADTIGRSLVQLLAKYQLRP